MGLWAVPGRQRSVYNGNVILCLTPPSLMPCSNCRARAVPVWSARTIARARSASAWRSVSAIEVKADTTSSVSSAIRIASRSGSRSASPGQRSLMIGVPQEAASKRRTLRRPSRCDHRSAGNVQGEALRRIECRMIGRRDMLQPLDIVGPVDPGRILWPSDHEPHLGQAARGLQQQPVQRRLAIGAVGAEIAEVPAWVGRQRPPPCFVNSAMYRRTAAARRNRQPGGRGSVRR